LAGIDEFLEKAWDLLLQFWPVGAEVGDQQVDECVGRCPNAIVGSGSAREFADEKDESAETGAELAGGRAVPLLADDFVIGALEFA
jgi:hypothetical protein